jgi:iron complex outermembrane receptor protein
MQRVHYFICALMYATCLISVSVSADGAQPDYDFNVPPQALESALLAVAYQTGMQLVIQSGDVKGMSSRGVSGRLGKEEAIASLLEGTGLVYVFTSDNTLVVKKKDDGQSSNGDGAGGPEVRPEVATRHAALEEIIVTAQKREQSVQDIGISITAFTADQIKELNFDRSTDIARMTPGLHISANDGGQKQLFTIRGVNQNDGGNQTESPVAVYIDEAYVALHQAQLFALFDMERIEVLKGPQGTLFGRNATGGLLHFVTSKPSWDFDGFGQLTYGSYDQIRLEGAIGGPLTETLAGRMAVMYKSHDEVLENTYPAGFRTLSGTPLPFGGADGGNDDTLGLRGHVLFQPNADISILLSANYARSQVATPVIFEVPAVPVYDAAGVQIDTVRASSTEIREAIGPGGIALDVPFSFDPDTTRPVAGGNLYGPSCTARGIDDLECSADSAFDNLVEDEVYGLMGKLTWQFKSFLLTSVTSYQYVESYHQLDGDSGPATTLAPVNALGGADTITQELRLNGETDRVRWVVGGYYLHVDSSPRFALKAEGQSLWLPLFGVPASDVVIGDMNTDSSSIFGQIEFDLSSSLTLIAGLRTIFEKKDYSTQETVFLNTDPKGLTMHTSLVTFRPERDFRQDDTLWSGKLQLDWRPADNWLFYAGINRGVKAGGFNAVATFGAPFDDSDIPYVEEVLLSYEAGFKADLLKNTVRVNGSFYFYDYDDYQGFVFRTAGGFISNADAKYKGLELEIVTAPVEGMDLALNMAYLDATVDDVEIGPGVFRDTEPSFSPELQAAGLLRYEWEPPVFEGRISAQADVSYVSSSFGDLRNFQAHKIDEYVVGNLSLGWNSLNDKWDVSFFVKNIADKRYTTVIIDTANLFGSVSEGIGMPRWFGVSVRRNLP